MLRGSLITDETNLPDFEVSVTYLFVYMETTGHLQVEIDPRSYQYW